MIEDYFSKERKTIVNKLAIAALSFLLLLSGCETAEQPLPASTPIEVALTMEPAAPKVQETTTFAVTVTQDGKPVPDARDVSFEIWKEGEQHRSKLPGAHLQNGVYTAQTALAEPGTYTVMYHVTARDLHSMNQKTFTVTGVQPEAAEPPGDAHGTEHHHGTGVEFHFHPDGHAVANKPVRWSVQLRSGNQALDKAHVQFEYWKQGEAHHQFIDVVEDPAGTYTATVTLASSGTYVVKVHVEKGSIHDHKEFQVSVSK